MYGLVILESVPKLFLRSAPPHWPWPHEWKSEQTSTRTRSVSRSMCSHSDLLWSKRAWHGNACEQREYLCFLEPVWISHPGHLLVLVSENTWKDKPPKVALRSWAMMDGAVAGSWEVPLPLCSVPACGKPWALLIPAPPAGAQVSLRGLFQPRSLRHGFCGPPSPPLREDQVIMHSFIGPGIY